MTPDRWTILTELLRCPGQHAASVEDLMHRAASIEAWCGMGNPYPNPPTPPVISTEVKMRSKRYTKPHPLLDMIRAKTGNHYTTAALLGLHSTTISGWRRGKRIADDYIPKLAEMAGISVAKARAMLPEAPTANGHEP